MYHAFPPLVSGRPKTLILGSFPSAISREKGEYYGNPRNIFWRVVFDASGAEFNSPSYDEKKEVLFANGLALWDVVASCEIVGALDKNIKNPVLNMELPGFVRENGIPSVIFNGAKAHELFRRGIGTLENVKIDILPSTSPANSGMSYAAKLARWAEALGGLKSG